MNLVIKFLTIQGFAIASPFIALILLQSRLKVDEVSVFLYLMTVAGVFGSIVEYGFNLTGIRITANLSESEGDKAISNIHAIKAALFVLSLPALIAICNTSTILKNDFPLTLTALLVGSFAIGFRPFWYFHGQQDLKVFLKTEICAHAIGILTLAIFINMNWSAAAYFSCYFAPRALLTIININKIHKKHKFNLQSPKEILIFAKQSVNLFIHKIFAMSVHQATTLILGFRLVPSELINFQQAEKIFTPLNNLLNNVTLSVLPVFAKTKDKKSNEYRLVAAGVQLLVSAAAGIFTWVYSVELMGILWKEYTPAAIDNLNYLSLALPLLGLNMILGMLYLFPLKKDNYILMSAALGGMASLGISLFASSNAGSKIGIIAILVGETLMMISMVFFASKK